MKKAILCLATNNAHKAEELKAVLSDFFDIKTLKEIGCFDNIEETGITFEENSLIKANYIHQKFGINVLADDSGLEVKALGGKPGVYSARYAGEPSDDTANNQKLIRELEGVTHREALFRTVLTLILDGEAYFFEGEVKGRIKESFNGEVSFGYNPVFIPDGFETTFHEMTFTQRTKLNHRGVAVQKLVNFLENRTNKG